MVGVTRTSHVVSVAIAVVCLSAWALTGCRTSTGGNEGAFADQSLLHAPRIPSSITRLAVWYPATEERDLAYAYLKLEQATFHLAQRRAGIRILERRALERVSAEQRLQVSGRVADDSILHIGQWLGADSLVLFQIDQPRWRDRVWARFSDQMAPVVVSSKIISVETGEVLYHDLVRILPASRQGAWDRYESDAELQSTVRASLDHAASVAIAHLDHAFR